MRQNDAMQTAPPAIVGRGLRRRRHAVSRSNHRHGFIDRRLFAIVARSRRSRRPFAVRRQPLGGIHGVDGSPPERDDGGLRPVRLFGCGLFGRQTPTSRWGRGAASRPGLVSRTRCCMSRFSYRSPPYLLVCVWGGGGRSSWEKITAVKIKGLCSSFIQRLFAILRQNI